MKLQATDAYSILGCTRVVYTTQRLSTVAEEVLYVANQTQHFIKTDTIIVTMQFLRKILK
jgi:hypothetical protein